jgi:radical SAM protein (TIGR04043 family)
MDSSSRLQPSHGMISTGSPPTPDRGALVLCESAAAVKAAVDLPLQAQCEPPDSNAWVQRLKDAGVDTLGMHLEVVGEALRQRILPGKAEVPLQRYWDAFEAAVAVFGRGQVSTYLLAGLGDSAETLLATSARLLKMGVYPFVVPFVPISGTPLEDYPAPPAEFMRSVLEPLGRLLAEAGLRATDIKAGCGRWAASATQSRDEAPLAA